MYRYIESYKINYTDVDAYDNLKPVSLLGFLQEAACCSADELGFGYDVVKKKNIGFILSGWYVELYRPLRYGEILTVHSWPLRPSNVIFLRDFELYVGEEKVGVATSRWCMLDIVQYKILPAMSFFGTFDTESWNTERSIDFNKWKIRSEGESRLAYSHKVGYGDYDHYFHVNNTRYADYLLSTFSEQDFKGKYVKSFQISYVKQCKIGDLLELYKSGSDGAYNIEGIVGGEVRVQMRVVLNEIQV